MYSFLRFFSSISSNENVTLKVMCPLTAKTRATYAEVLSLGRLPKIWREKVQYLQFPRRRRAQSKPGTARRPGQNAFWTRCRDAWEQVCQSEKAEKSEKDSVRFKVLGWEVETTRSLVDTSTSRAPMLRLLALTYGEQWQLYCQSHSHCERTRIVNCTYRCHGQHQTKKKKSLTAPSRLFVALLPSKILKRCRKTQIRVFHNKSATTGTQRHRPGGNIITWCP